FAYVGSNATVSRCLGNWPGLNQTIRILVVIIIGKRKLTTKQADIQSYIQLLASLPAQYRVAQCSNGCTWGKHIVDHIVYFTNLRDMGIVTNIVITGNAITTPQLQHAQLLHIS